MSIQIKRVYASPDPDDGVRILIDRLWPRGLSKEAAAVDDWLKDCAPSDELRKWFAHDASKWAEFKRRYFAELAEHEDLLEPVRTRARAKRVTLLFGAADVEHNNAVALLEYLKRTRPGGHLKKNHPGEKQMVRH